MIKTTRPEGSKKPLRKYDQKYCVTSIIVLSMRRVMQLFTVAFIQQQNVETVYKQICIVIAYLCRKMLIQVKHRSTSY